jgi:hypothetical protein
MVVFRAATSTAISRIGAIFSELLFGVGRVWISLLFNAELMLMMTPMSDDDADDSNRLHSSYQQSEYRRLVSLMYHVVNIASTVLSADPLFSISISIS